MGTDFRKEIGTTIDQRRDEYTKISDAIWGFAEPRFQEYESTKLQQEFLKARGFSVKADLAGEETAFIAEWGSGKPILAFLGEFDALSSLQQEADCTERRPIAGKTDGHGCGHHLLGTASVAAVDALKSYMEEKDLKGTIRYYGCPAEENAGGKAYLVRDGYFNDCDIAITWHPSTTNKTMGDDKFLANFRVFFTFHGISSHAAGAPELGRSALDACELMNVGVNYLREHVKSDARMHYAYLNDGGDAPNIVPAAATLLYAPRAPESAYVTELYDRVSDVAKGAALMTGTRVSCRTVSAYAELLSVPAMDALMMEAMQEAEKPEYTDDDYEYAARFAAENLPVDAILLTADEHNNPFACLSGFTIVQGSPSFLYFHGIYDTDRAADVTAMYTQEGALEELAGKYGITHVVLSEYEYNLGADAALFEELPVVFSSHGVTIYSLK